MELEVWKEYKREQKTKTTAQKVDWLKRINLTISTIMNMNSINFTSRRLTLSAKTSKFKQGQDQRDITVRLADQR